MPSLDSLIAAGRNRLRPIAMTTIAAILTLMPLALAIGQGSAMQQPPIAGFGKDALAFRNCRALARKRSMSGPGGHPRDLNVSGRSDLILEI
jgi:AcrB/AcrD/AcrF family